MRVYLVQHAEAMSEEQDPDRSLTDNGREHTQWTAAVAAEMGVEVDQIRHSGKTRARQTAEILGEALGPSEGVVEVPGLAPLDDVVGVGDELEDGPGPFMLVGHLPFMERLAGHLLAGDASKPVVGFQNAGIVCLHKTDERWQAMWIVTPEVAAIMVEA